MKKSELDYLMQKYDIIPRKEQGQNFLLNDKVIADIVAAAELKPTDTAMEIGPGFGVLTKALAEAVERVVTVEQDRDMFPAVQALQASFPSIEPYNADIREFNRNEVSLKDLEYSLVANLPYSITSWIIREFLEHAPRPKQMVVMVQREVAERIIAEPGEMSLLACAVQVYAQASIVRIVKPGNFFPAPKVDSAVLKIVRRDNQLVEEPEELIRTCKIGFAQRRKTLLNNLRNGLHIEKAAIEHIFNALTLDTAIRPQELSIGQWKDLYLGLKEISD